MKVALIGMGRWGQVLLKELKEQAEVKYECDSQTDLGPVFSDPEVGAVFIATPTETHFELAKRVLEAGKHVFLEKPGTTNSGDLEKLVNLAKEKSLTFAVGYEFAHHPAAQKLKELMRGKKAQSIHFSWQKWGTFKDDAVKHLLCHDVSVLKYLGFNDLKFILHHREGAISKTDITWTQFGSAQVGYIESNINRISPIKQKTLTIILEDGGYIWSNDELFAIDPNTQALQKIEVDAVTPVANEIKDFLSSVAIKTQPLANGQFALEVYKVIEQV